MSGVMEEQHPETWTTSAGSRPLAMRLRAFVELGKIRLSALAIFAVVAGIFLGHSGTPSTAMVVAATVGTMLIAMAGNAANMLIEREHDKLMERTRGRPLPTGRLTPGEVLGFAVTCTLVGLVVLAVWTNWLATLLCASILVSYVAIYTPLKRVTAWNTVVGAVPGALPPVVGYAAATGRVDIQALGVFLILFLWQVPHFFAIAWTHRHDYERGGHKMLTVTDKDGGTVRLLMLVHTLALIPISLMPYFTGLSGERYAVSAVLLGVLFLAPVVLAAVARWESAMRGTFVTSIIYLPLLFSIMVLDRMTI